ncbi:hypothetical protein AAG570_001468 [Ranatra chinensis]|uniref:FAD-dependent oxidoreductase domain-containing protein 1 n=1 Tax=Ranatra chinensis TaxID=642074 RepID=A0ABD0Y8L4_9HEMI
MFKSDFVDMKDRLLGKTLTARERDIPRFCDVLIIGGGVMGSAIAYWLKWRTLDGLKVVVIEKDSTVIEKNPNSFKVRSYRDSSTTLSVGGLRQQFSLKENIELSLYTADFFRNIKEHLSVKGGDPPDVQFNPSGYLFLSAEDTAHTLVENARLQRSLGAKVELLSLEKLKEKFPWLNTEGLFLGCHGLENEGWFDPWSLLFAFKRKAMSLGAEYVEGEVTGFNFKQGSEYINQDISSEDVKHLEGAQVKLKDGQTINLNCGLMVLAAGPQSGEIGRLMGLGAQNSIYTAPIPVEPRKRYVYSVHCPDGPGFSSPILIDPSGTYFRREGLGGNYLCGRSPTDEEEPPTDNLEVDYDFFESKVWPILAHRVPAFEKCKVKSAWAGYYDFNYFDENAVIGHHPGFCNLYMATGFSGHGIQQAPGVGRAVMEMLIDGEFKTIDLSRLSFERYIEKIPLWESNIV